MGRNFWLWLPGFNGEWLVQELFVEVLFDVMYQNDCFALVVELRSTCSSHHLQHIYTKGEIVLKGEVFVKKYHN